MFVEHMFGSPLLSTSAMCHSILAMGKLTKHPDAKIACSTGPHRQLQIRRPKSDGMGIEPTPISRLRFLRTPNRGRDSRRWRTLLDHIASWT